MPRVLLFPIRSSTPTFSTAKEPLTAEHAERAEKPKLWLCVLCALGGERLLAAVESGLVHHSIAPTIAGSSEASSMKYSSP